MTAVTDFSTVTEMFDKVTSKFASDSRPMFMYKAGGKYIGYSFVDMKNYVDQFANGLAALGVKSGNTVALVSENRPEWVVADIAMMKLGAINVSIYPSLTPKQLEYILNDAGASYAVVSNQLQLNKILKILDDVPTLRRIIVISDIPSNDRPRVISYSNVMEMGTVFKKLYPDFVDKTSKKIAEQNIMTLIYTSGTTGNPKGVMLTHRNITSNIKAATERIPFTHEDTILSFLPLSHSYERTAGYYTAMACGATIAYAESIDTVRENLLEVRPTIVTTVPRLFERFYNRLMKQMGEEPAVRQKIFNWAIRVGKTYACARRNKVMSPALSVQYKLADKLVFGKIRERTGGRINFFASGGAALSAELGEFFEAIGIQIIEGYGMTEASPVISVNLLHNYKWGSVGPALPGVEVVIAHDGEILVKGPNVMQGYWNNQAATDEAIDKDGWLHTGDIGVIDEDGFIKITDRKKHLFVSSGGKNIAPQPIESLFLKSEYIDQFVLIGDGKMYLTALIVPNFDSVRDVARKIGIKSSKNEDLASHPEIHKLLDSEISRLQRDLSAYERVRKFTILSAPFSIENDEMTPTMKIKRKVVEQKFKDLIEKMYEGFN